MRKGHEFLPAFIAFIIGWLCLGIITSIAVQQKYQPLNQSYYGKT